MEEDPKAQVDPPTLPPLVEYRTCVLCHSPFRIEEHLGRQLCPDCETWTQREEPESGP